MKTGKAKIKKDISHLTLAEKIRYFCILLMIPFVLLNLFCIWSLWDINNRYEGMIDSTLTATRFGLDFKVKFDYETYLLIAGNTPVSESVLPSMLKDADKTVNGICENTDSYDNRQRLQYVLKYLNNLSTYTQRIEANLLEGNKYEECIEIWENDVQIVTTLISDTMSEYTYFEVLAMQEAKIGNQKTYNTVTLVSMSGLAVCLILIIILSYKIPQSITRPITEITHVTDEVANGNLGARAKEYEGDEAKVLAESINAMIDRINRQLVQIKEEQLSLRKAELELLQAQINPHFLYNTLDAIVWLAESGEKEQVVKMVENLSSFFHTSLSQGKELVTLKDEIMHITSYLSIQQIRYQDILKYEIKVPENIMYCGIPKLSLQPLVENALYHGIKEKRGGGTIVVTGSVLDEKCVIEVCDDGKGMTPARLAEVRSELDDFNKSDRSIYGMFNVNQRIRLNYGPEYGISVDSVENEGTKARIIIPL